jgi:hypothetical protein
MIDQLLIDALRLDTQHFRSHYSDSQLSKVQA